MSTPPSPCPEDFTGAPASTDNDIILTTVNPNLKGSNIEVYFTTHAPREWSWTDYLVSVSHADQDDESKKLSCFAKYVGSLQTIRAKNESVAGRATALLKELMDPAVAPVQEADGGSATSPDVAGSNSAEDASNQSLEANALTAANPNLRGARITVYFTRHAAIDWSWIGYLNSKGCSSEDGKDMIHYFANFVTSLGTICKKKGLVAEHAKALLKKFMEPALRSVRAVISPLEQPPDKTIQPQKTVAKPSHSKESQDQVTEELEAVNYHQAFKNSLATLSDQAHIDADNDLSRHFEGKCTVEQWPGVDELLSNVFGESSENSWATSLAIVRGLPMNVMLNSYLFVIFDKYARYFKYHKGIIPDTISEREGWGDITWPIISGALDILDIKTRYLEVLVTGNGITKQFSPTSKILVDGVGFSGSSQIYVAEASKLQKPKLNKKEKDYQKLMRAMGDLAIEHRRTKVTRPSPTASTVYGSYSFANQTRFYAMDATKNIPLRQLDLMMIVPLTEEEIPRMLPNCLRVALRFAWIVSQEHKDRMSMEVAAEVPSDMPIVHSAETSLDPVPVTAAASSASPTMQAAMSLVPATEEASSAFQAMPATETFLDPALTMQTLEESSSSASIIQVA